MARRELEKTVMSPTLTAALACLSDAIGTEPGPRVHAASAALDTITLALTEMDGVRSALADADVSHSGTPEEQIRGLSEYNDQVHEWLRAWQVWAQQQVKQPESGYWGDEGQRTRITAALTEIERVKAQNADLTAKVRDVINIDRTGLAAGLNHVQAVARGWSWIAEGTWGPYSYEYQTVETLQREVSYLITSVLSACDRALKQSGKRADAAARFVPVKDPVTGERIYRRITPPTGAATPDAEAVPAEQEIRVGSVWRSLGGDSTNGTECAVLKAILAEETPTNG